MRSGLGRAARYALLLGWCALPACDDGGGGGQAPAADGGIEADGGDCSPGTEGCRCLMDDTCRLPALTCSMGTCQALTEPCDPAEERCPPAEPQCYTPCRGNIVDPDGTVRVCLADGVIRGCLAGAQCLQGSCTAIAAPNAQVADPGICARPADCPAFQTCLRGRCYAECEQNAECDAMPGNPRTCVHRVCREQCGQDMPCTDPETYCDTGICQKLLPPGEPSVIVPGAFELVDANVVFTASSTTGALRLRNTGTGDLTLTVRKADQISIAPDDTPETIVDQPLPWLTLNGERVDRIEVEVPEGGEAVVALGGAADHGFSRYTGHLEITGPGLPIQQARVAYSTGVTGRWSGTAFVFGTFEGGAEIDAWMASKPSETNIPNAFMQVWASYRNGGLPLDEMGALVQATLTGAWDQPRVRALCAAAGNADGVVCAPFNNADGVIPYVSNVDANPVPAGVVETPFSIEVRAGDCGDGAPDGATCASGRIDSDVALHYPADPAIDLVFNADPSGCERENASQGCVTTLAALDARMAIGARQPGACRGVDSAEATVRQPWLVNGFRPAAGDIQGTEAQECRRGGAPFGDGMLADDQRFAEANPVPDGRPRQRRLSLIDGLLIEQNLMVLLMRETLDPVAGAGAPLVSYQYVVLTREQADPADLRPVGNRGADPTPLAQPRPAACELRGTVGDGGPLGDLDAAGKARAARYLVDGVDEGATELQGLTVYSLCLWDEQVGAPEIPERDVQREILPDSVGDEVINPGMVSRAVVNAGPDGDRPCFPGAEIIYFAGRLNGDPVQWACNQPFQQESCLEKLRVEAQRDGQVLHLDASAANRFADLALGDGVELDLVPRCADGGADCSDDRFDLTAGKRFWLSGAAAVFKPLGQSVAEAFRYKTTFVNRAGTSLGFSPVPCSVNGRPDPYCFDQAQIAEIQQRVTCLLELAEGPEAPIEAIQGLQTVYGALGGDPEDPVLSRGFEDLFAELAIMRGDEALTAAYNTRYAVGQGQGLPFEGELFENDGLNLSGIAGAEMVYLYSAVQAYDLALGRFFGQVPTLWANAIEPIRERRYVTEDTVTGWMQRVIRASTQRARAQSEIARRYQVFGRPDLARRVIQRAYVRAHQEGLVLSSLMGAIADRVGEEYKPQVRHELAQAQRRYRVALLEMGDVHAQVVSGTDYFGFPQGYVPFPALDEDAVNGFEEMLGRAMDRLELAAADEERAIAERREFDSDEAAFRAELLTQRNSYETALGTLCGTFIGTDGRTWPAIPAYVHLMPDNERVVGDPCGRVGNGDIYLKAADLQTAELLLTRVRQEATNALAEMRDVFNEVKDRCALVNEDAAVFLERQQVIDGIEGGIDGMELSISIIDKLYDFITEGTNRAIEANNEDTPAGIFMDSLSNGAWVVAAGAHFASTTVLESTILTSRGVIREKARKYEEWQIQRECAYLEHERGYQIRALERDFLLTRLDVLQTAWDVDVVISQLRSLLNERNRIESEWADAQQLTAEAAAAQSDPTKRIYKNDAIRNAEQSFEVALRAAWQATLTYEYYTGSTYPQRDVLFLARLVDRGDIPLRRYLEDLRERFFAFEQVYGNPDTRVARISVCNDIFDISYLDASGQARDDLDRAEECRRRLKDPAMLDASGALRIPFSTDFDALSPRTVNHKILFAEIGLAGDLGGDGVARAYLESSGTGVVTGTDGQRRFYTFPPRTAVMNPVFRDDEGLTFGQDSDGAITGPTRSIYRSYRFRERPFVQSSWALVIDQRAEAVNRDIDLGAVTDIVIDFFYTDFTEDSQ